MQKDLVPWRVSKNLRVSNAGGVGGVWFFPLLFLF